MHASMCRREVHGSWARFEADRDRVVRRWLHSVETGEDYETEARLVRAQDGAARWWKLRA